MKPKINLKPIIEAPNLQLLKNTFGVDEKDLIIAYGDKIFCPEKGLSQDLIVHELVHCERQQFNEQSAERWWQKYMEDKDFRLNEEVLAYRQQYKFCEKVYKDRNARARILFALTGELAGERYGKLCARSEAFALIKK